ncbi:MAG: hypothetical protein LBG92_10455 [Prevotellaceae bacterium]|jgi:hypothetical protein|nr:hypothetical protein [Prevotellaceae bacterium]
MDEGFVNAIYRGLLVYDYCIRSVPKEDVLQEIRLSILVSDAATVWSTAQRNVRRLLRQMGFNIETQMKYEIDCERLLAKDGLSEHQGNLIDELYEKYVIQNRTFRQICEEYNIPPTHSLKLYFSRVFAKDRKLNRAGKTGCQTINY